MSEFDRDSLVDKVNRQLMELRRFAVPNKTELKKIKMLEILLRRYIGGERHERLFDAMKKTISNLATEDTKL